MKKTYIHPKTLAVRLRPHSAILTESILLDNSQENKLDDGEILVKESDANSWNNEW